MKSLLSRIEFAASCHDDYGALKEAVSSGNGKVTEYAYDAAGRMTREGAKTYRYGYLDKVLSVAEGKDRRTFTYHVDGQLATATRTGGPRSVAAPPHTSTNRIPEMRRRSIASKGSRERTTSSPSRHLFTGKPEVDGLGYAFLFRNYRARLGKWQTADPLGYPDGWNQMAYGINSPMMGLDLRGGRWYTNDFIAYYFTSNRIYGDSFDTDCMGLTGDMFSTICSDVIPRIEQQINIKVATRVFNASGTYGNGSFFYTTSNAYDFSDVCYPLGYGSVRTQTQIGYSWYQETRDDLYRYFVWSATVRMIDYSDIFADPINVGIEIPGGQAYSYYHTWTNSKQFAGADWVVIE